MKKKIKWILSLACASMLCFSAAACWQGDQLEEYQKEGYTISVTYDANGGTYLERPGVTIIDLFNPDDYQKDENGKVHISLKEPTDTSRPTSSSSKVTLTMEGHFFAGWYQERTLLKNEAGAVVDTAGVALEKTADGYVYPGTTEAAFPAYTYAKYWDFENDTIDYAKDDGIYAMTLYAAWVPYFEFHYYYQVEGKWELLEATKFDYKSTNAEGSTSLDRDTIWVPNWKDGAMNHEYRYQDNEVYKFPTIKDATFEAAYTDPECQNVIEGSLEHHGELNIENGTAKNYVQDIYIKTKPGAHYKIEKAMDLVMNPNVNGIYEIAADLDFTGLKWPAAFEVGTFMGEFCATEGNTFTIKNVTATHNSTSASQGGLFGRIGKDAKIANVNFENVTLDIAATNPRMQDGYFGLFAGFIEEGAKISGISINGMIRIGEITWDSEKNTLNILASGQLTGITMGEVKLRVYGGRNWAEQNSYYYTINPETIIIDEDNNILLAYKYGQKFNQEFYDIDLKEINGGK